MNRVYRKRLKAAFARAVDWHAKQERKASGTPYLCHLMAVAATVMENRGGPDEVIAALLHDAVEDAGGLPTLRKIRKEFGDRVAEIVQGCTDADIRPKPPWRQRKKTYIAHIATAAPSVRLVSASDKLCNARSILADYRRLGPAVWRRFKGKRDGTLWYYRSLIEAYSKAGPTPVVQELAATVGQLEAEVAAREGPPRKQPRNARERMAGQRKPRRH